jgi:hypothetical protein
VLIPSLERHYGVRGTCYVVLSVVTAGCCFVDGSLGDAIRSGLQWPTPARDGARSESRDGYGPGTLVPLDIIVSGTAACGVRGHRPSPSGIS